jgi:SAM-dependent methyltransferase
MQHPSNPQSQQMSDESMVRNLAAQAEAIWPQERGYFSRYALPENAAILDLGCGTGEITGRLAELFPSAEILGVDLDAAHLNRARSRNAGFGPRVRFQQADALDLPFPDGGLDLCVCRHLIQAVPDPQRLLHEMTRVTRRGGRLHLLAEDYGMIQFWPTRRDADRFWRQGPMVFGAAMGTDLQIGRKAFTLMSRMSLADITIDYVTVDTARVPRPVFARIWEAWRDGYAEGIAEKAKLPLSEVIETFDEMIGCIRHPQGYGVWQVPVLSARIP